jgi:hypothetical protein
MIEYSDTEYNAAIETHRETTRDHIKFERLLGAVPADIPDEDITAHYLYYPACVSCSTGIIVFMGDEINVRDLTFEQFMNLPGPFFSAWVQKVFTDNPHFLPNVEKELTAAGDAEKKS